MIIIIIEKNIYIYIYIYEGWHSLFFSYDLCGNCKYLKLTKIFDSDGNSSIDSELYYIDVYNYG